MRILRQFLALMLFLSACTRFTVAQSPQNDWGTVKQLRSGEKIEVVDSSMRSLAGKFVSASDDAVVVETKNGQQSIQRAAVVRVSIRDSSRRTRNMLLGSGIAGGIALGIAIPLWKQQSNEGNNCPACTIAVAAGFGGGAALGALSGTRTIYRTEPRNK